MTPANVGGSDDDIQFVGHALENMADRGIARAEAVAVVNRPGQVLDHDRGRRVFQARESGPGGKMILLRVIVDTRTLPWTVLTAYRTSKVSKYWRDTP